MNYFRFGWAALILTFILLMVCLYICKYIYQQHDKDSSEEIPLQCPAKPEGTSSQPVNRRQRNSLGLHHMYIPHADLPALGLSTAHVQQDMTSIPVSTAHTQQEMTSYVVELPPPGSPPPPYAEINIDCDNNSTTRGHNGNMTTRGPYNNMTTRSGLPDNNMSNRGPFHSNLNHSTHETTRSNCVSAPVVNEE